MVGRSTSELGILLSHQTLSITFRVSPERGAMFRVALLPITLAVILICCAYGSVSAQDIPRLTPCKRINADPLLATPNQSPMMSVTQLPDMGPDNPASGAFISSCLWSANGHYALLINPNGEWTVYQAQTPFGEKLACCVARSRHSTEGGFHTLKFFAYIPPSRL